MPPRAASGAAAAEANMDPQPTPQGTSALFDFNPILGIPMRVKSYSQQQSGGSSSSRQSVGAAYGAFLQNLPSGADPSRWPNVQQYSKAMLRAVSKEDKDALP